MSLTQAVKDIGNISKIIYDMYIDDNQLVNALNKISLVSLESLFERYKNSKNRPVNELRFSLIQELKKNNISREKLDEIVDKHRNEKQQQLKSWKNNFKIFHPLILESINIDLNNKINNFINLFYEKTNLNNNLKHNIVSFTGAKHQGSERLWIAFYNKELPSQSSSKQFFIEFFKDTITYGFYTHYNKKYITNKINTKIEIFEVKEFFDYFNKNENLILNDKPSGNLKQLSQLFQKYNENDVTIFLSLIKYLLKKNNILKGNERLSYAAYDLKLTFFVGKKSFLVLNSNNELLKFNQKTKLNFDVVDDLEMINDEFLIELKKKGKSNRLNENNTVFEDYIFDTVMKDENYNYDLDSENYKEKPNFPLNQILYGPPGTGKTYNTVRLAVQILNCLEELPNYDDAITEYNRLIKEGRLSFVTFHQNFSYEDFVQGLRPETDSDTMSFDYKPGVFKEIADKGRINLETSLGKKSNKMEFENVYNDFCSPMINEELEEIEVEMKKVSYFITSVGEKTINFRKNSGGTSHTLSVKTLKKMYETESLLNHSGLLSYYEPLLNILLEKGKKEKSNTEKFQKQSYVLIIDEINRANISRVFGELITLIEDDKRWDGGVDDKKVKWEVTLPSGEPFVVPDNLYIIGTMNTADKSIALLDVALRRRFVFKAMYPMKDIDGKDLDKNLINNHELLSEINNYIIDEQKGLGPGRGHDLQIGHSYFMTPKDKTFDLVETMNNKVIPLLMEYFMNDYKKVNEMLETILKSDANKEPKLILTENSYPLIVKTESPEVTE